MPALQGPKDELDLKAIARTVGVICKRFAQLPKADQKYVLDKLSAIAKRPDAPPVVEKPAPAPEPPPTPEPPPAPEPVPAPPEIEPEPKPPVMEA